ncbi:hypothetical protein [Promicromonospora soli]
MTCLAGAVAGAVLMAGCTAEPPTPEPEAPAVAAVVSTAQERKILDRVSDVVTGARQDGDPGALEARLAGPALAMREAELAIAAKRGENKVLTDLTMEPQQLVLPSDQDWPRSSFAVAVLPEDGTTPVLAAFEQARPRDQYKLWAYVQLVSGVTMPRFAEAELGSAAVGPDDTSLVVAPAAVAEQYASVLTEGDGSRYADSFATDDYLRQSLRQSGKEQVAEIEKKDGAGSFEVAFEPTDDPVKAVRTVDGGAMVLVALRSQETLRAEEGWQLVPEAPSAKALWGGATGTDVMKIAYRYTAAVYVPPAESEGRISLVGFHRVPYAVSND